MSKCCLKSFGTFAVIFAVIFVLMSFLKYWYDKTNVTVYFVKANGATKTELVPVARKYEQRETRLDFAVDQLLKGPNGAEKDRKLFSEIPSATSILKIEHDNGTAKVNLSESFESGGGSESMETRVKQLVKTVRANDESEKVFFFINGKQADYVGGEGVEVSQPIEK